MKTSTLSKLLLALLTLSMLAIPINMTQVAAEPVTYPSTKPNIIEWFGTGPASHDTLAWNPEYLKLMTGTYVHSNTTIIVQGQDVFGQNIEAKVVIPPGTGESALFIFNDTHTNPPQPVAFAKITGIFQQNGTHCNKFRILTHPDTPGSLKNTYIMGQLEQTYLGYYVKDGFGPIPLLPWRPNYFEPNGDDLPPTQRTYPIEPSNPDPIKILFGPWSDDGNWMPAARGDLIPEPGFDDSFGTAHAATLWIEGLDERGMKMNVTVTIPAGATEVIVDKTTSNIGDHTWSTICKVGGGTNGDEYYIFTHPHDQLELFTYYLRIDHITITPACYDILANPDVPEGQTTITVALRDQDDHMLHWGDPNPLNPIIVNFYTSGGKIHPSNDGRINLCQTYINATLYADTNARTINVTADVNIPAIPGKPCPAMNAFAWTEVTFDGINSVLYTGSWPIHTMMWGYTTWLRDGTVMTTHTGPVPPKPWLPWTDENWKFDGPIYEVMIPLYVGCNLISVPVHPFICNTYFCEAWGGPGIPMDLLFGNTSATDCIEAIWWYDGTWHWYIPKTGAGAGFLNDGVGYWIKAEKPCTLEISGVIMENAPFTPPEYPVLPSWNLMGVTSIYGIATSDYFQSLSVGDFAQFWGPVWVYYAKYGLWVRNPATLWPTEAVWMYYKQNMILLAPTVAP